jgi:hypothetical protein
MILIIGSLLLIGFSFILVCHSVTTAAYERSERKRKPVREPAPVVQERRTSPPSDPELSTAPIAAGPFPRLVWHNDGGPR